MATRYLRPGGSGLWNNTNNWSATEAGATGASFPVNGDDVILATSNSAANIQINVTSACTTFTVEAGYTGTVSGSSQLTVAGAVNLGASMNLTATGLLNITLAATHLFNGITWPGNMTVNATGTHTFNDAARCTGLLTLSTSIGATRTYAGTGSIRADGGITLGNTASSVISVTMTGGLILGGGTLTHGTNSRMAGLLTVVASATITGSLQMTGTLLQTGGTLTWSSTPQIFLANTGSGTLILSVTSPLTGVQVNIPAGGTLLLNGGQPWTATSKLVATGTAASLAAVVSSTGGVQASQTLPTGMTIDLNYCNLTDIAADQPLYTSRGTVSNCSNCQALNPYTVPFVPLGGGSGGGGIPAPIVMEY